MTVPIGLSSDGVFDCSSAWKKAMTAAPLDVTEVEVRVGGELRLHVARGSLRALSERLREFDGVALDVEDVTAAGFAGLAEFFLCGRLRLPDRKTCDRVQAAAEAYGVDIVQRVCRSFVNRERRKTQFDVESAAGLRMARELLEDFEGCEDGEGFSMATR